MKRLKISAFSRGFAKGMLCQAFFFKDNATTIRNYAEKMRLVAKKSDQDSLSSDWNAVAHDLRTALTLYPHEQK